MKELHLTKGDFRIDWFSGTGAGGQYRNKHQNCCRITHIESGITCTGQSNRERPANQKEAFEKLAGRLIALYCVEDAERLSQNNIPRTYHFERNEVSDGVITLRTDTVMDGNIDEFIKNALNGARPERKTGRM